MSGVTNDLSELFREVRIGDKVEPLVPGRKWGTVYTVVKLTGQDGPGSEQSYTVRWPDGTYEWLTREEFRVVFSPAA